MTAALGPRFAIRRDPLCTSLVAFYHRNRRSRSQLGRDRPQGVRWHTHADLGPSEVLMLHRQEPDVRLGRQQVLGDQPAPPIGAPSQLAKRRSGFVIHGEKSPKINWDCTICLSCRLTMSWTAAPKTVGKRHRMYAFGWTPEP